MNYGVRENLGQILQQTLQVLLVGMTLGMMRTVVPALAETEFGLPRGSFMLLSAFVVAFGVVKGGMNFVAGRLAESQGRRRVLLLGWLVAFPIPLVVYFAPTWNWVVAATVLLGINQGLTWSMTQTSKLDLTRSDQRGLVVGLNEFAGYAGMAIAGIVTGYAASMFGPREGLLWFGLVVIGLATVLAVRATVETLPWAKHDANQHRTAAHGASSTSGPSVAPGHTPSMRDVFALMTWRDRRLAALCQAGLVEKFVDALVWVFWPVYLHQQGASLTGIGGIVSVYGFTWGVAQLLTGRLSDRFGRQPFNVGGMFVCGLGVIALPLGTGALWWSAAAGVAGLGMAMLYPNLSAAVADLAHPSWRASAIGIYRFWRDLGYSIGALGLGLVAAMAGSIEPAFWCVGIAMALSGLWLGIRGAETCPRESQPER